VDLGFASDGFGTVDILVNIQGAVWSELSKLGRRSAPKDRVVEP
jgi:hypothetical protein